MQFAALAKEQMNLLGEFAFPNGARILQFGPFMLALRVGNKQKPIPNPWPSDELADAPTLNEKFRR